MVLSNDEKKAIMREMGSKGGRKTKRKLGKAHYRKIALKRWGKEEVK